ncbi:DNA mismatch repair protein MSH6 isoform X3 [Selaginella moellendorffii]|uniref:DNA mismatch repair protein MSH6 isoform X3 n=1 Tax=Selaginella moellendorffii TaxID=88036 RepID=UPI000D1CE1AD|nr:DNA mismatch repair protein MSH6 isoform X3 [Selaginella moellendorffii]|eukprot:XP_024530362.1 DNA mismatch repair protein MSH6 isoform X3 [Selaginella moellendorffii]
MAPHRRSSGGGSGGGGGAAAKQQRSIASFFSPGAPSPAAKKVLVINDATTAASNPALSPKTHDRQEEDTGKNDRTAVTAPNEEGDDEKSKESPLKRPADDNVCGSPPAESSKSLKRLKKVVLEDGDDEEFLEKMDLENSHCGKTRRSSSVSSASAAVKTSDGLGAPRKRLRKKYVVASSDDDSGCEVKGADVKEKRTMEDEATIGEIPKEDTRQRAEELEKITRFKEETVRQIEPATTRADECCEADRSLLLSGEALERFGGRISRKFSFLGKNRKDSSGRRHDWPNFDSRTLFLPAEFVKGLTGGQRQWWEFKAKHMDKVLLFKMGKFYEMFEMDAHVGAQDLDLQYMKGEQPHCGFPEKNYFENVEKLVRKGHRVLVVEQTETPEQLEERKRKTGSKDKVVRREICAIITKGTMVDSGMISDNAEPSFLAAVTEKADNYGSSLVGLCVVDASRALFMLGQVEDDSARTKLRSILTELRPVELVLPLGLLTDATQKALREQTRKPLISQLVPSKEFWDAEQTTKEIRTSYGASDAMPTVLQKILELGVSSEPVLSAFGGCICYLRQSLLDGQLLQLGRFELLPGSDLSFEHSAAIPEADPAEAHMVLDSAALDNLEILENSSNCGVAGTLLCLLDHCITPFGRRLLKQWIVRPLCNIESIVQRQNAVVDMQGVAENAVSEFRRELFGIPDLERLLARLSANSGENGRHSQKVVLYEDAAKKQIKELVAALRGFQKLVKAVSCFGNCLPQLKSARLRSLLTFGKGFPDLKPLLQYFEDSFDWSESEANGRVTGGDHSNLSASDPREKLESYLKSQQKFFKNPEQISYVTVGKDTYLLEIPEELHTKVPSDYELRSSRKGFCRYWTPRVKELLQELSLCENEKEAALRGILQTLTKRFCDDHDHWLSAIRAVSELDALMSISSARLHMDGMTCLPTFVPASQLAKPVFRAKALRHPIVAVSTAASTPFVPNDVVLGGGSNPEVMLLTGPNMGGKSTLLRQVCLGMILAQIGSEVPAESLELSLTDRLFVRMGAKDQIMTGQSTFLIELLETAVMLRCATQNSFVALDELGRGTATSDGQAIAHAVLHYLAHNVQCRGMFSSHYHKLASDFANDPSVSLCHMACKVGGGNNELEAVTFLYKLTSGSCPKSYGVNVARIAGMPESVLRRAVLQSAKLEKEVESHCHEADIIKTILDASVDSAEQLRTAWEKAKLI